MKRIVVWLLGTVTIVTLLFGYRTSTEGAITGSDQAVISSNPRTGSDASGNSTGTGPGGSGAGGSGDGNGTASNGSRTVTGSVAQTRWGPVQVRLTVANGGITDVSVLRYPDSNHKDRQINAYALPILVDETLTAQSADIDMVGGATVTSRGYVESLQAALDEAGL